MENRIKENRKDVIPITTLYTLYSTFELKAALMAASLWSFLNFLLGGIDTPIRALTLLMALDFFTGVAAAYKAKDLNSETGWHGLTKKGCVFLFIAFAYLLDSAMDTDTLRGMVISGFAIIEALSVLENIDRLGYGHYLPDFLRSHLKKVAATKYLIRKETNTNEETENP